MSPLLIQKRATGGRSRRRSGFASPRNSGPPIWRWEAPLTPSPIGKVLSIFRTNRVRALLMGGQACILYGAAEFSRDVDIAVAADDKNLNRLRQSHSDGATPAPLSS